MNSLTKKYGIILQLVTFLLSLIWFLDFNNIITCTIVNIVTFIFIMFTIFLSFKSTMSKKMKQYYTLMIICTIFVSIIYCLLGNKVYIENIMTVVSFPIILFSLLQEDKIRVSERFLGFIITISGVFSLFKIGNINYISNLSLILIPLSIILLYKESNNVIKLIYIISSIVLLSLNTDKIYIFVLLVLFEILIDYIKKYKNKVNNKLSNKINLFYTILYLYGIFLVGFGVIQLSLPVSLIMSIIAIKIYCNTKKSLLFTSYDLGIGGIETALVNLLNSIDKKKYSITLILEKKEGTLLNKISNNVYIKSYPVYNFNPRVVSKLLNLLKRAIYSLFNYNTYDFSCCYATYSYSGNKIAKISSHNSSIWVHSNYKQAYSNINDTIEFFDSRKMDQFRRIIFVSNESERDYLELYPEHQGKTLVFNNLIDVDSILRKKSEKVETEKPKNKKLFVFVGRLDEKSKKITRIINIAKNIDNIAIWIIGDGKDRNLYEKLIKDNKLERKITMFGSIKEPYNYMSMADYVILTSDYEGFPVVYLESLVLGKEIITTIPVSDDSLDFNKIAHIISKDNYIDDVEKVLNNKKNKNKLIDLKEIQKKRLIKLDNLFKGEI